MKFHITRETFLDGLQKVQNIVSNRSSLPILSNVLLVAKDGTLQMTTTDLDAGMSVTVKADVKQDGVTTLPVRKLAAIVRELPAPDVEVSVDQKNHASIRCGPSFFKIIGLSKDEFPPLPDFANSKEFRISQSQMKDGLRKVAYAISTDEARYVLNGIFASFREGKMTLVATDGRRLAMTDYDLDFPATHEMDVIIPTKAVTELQRLLKDDGEFSFKMSGNQASFVIEDTILVTKTIDGNYPNYRQVIPGEGNVRVIIDRALLLETVHRVALLSMDAVNSVKLIFNQNRIEITSNTPDVGEAQEGIDVQYDGPVMQIAFNPGYLQAPLKALETENIYLDLIDEVSPGVVRIDGTFLYVIMPMRVTH